MASARSILTAPPYQTPTQRKMAALRALVGQGDAAKARAKAQKAARAADTATRHLTTTNVVQSLVDRKHGLVTAKDVAALVAVTGTPKDAILEIIETAKERFSGAAVEYVNIHKEATQMALANGDAKSLAVATKAAEWAIEKMEHKGTRVVTKEQIVKESGGTKILIGFGVGGVDKPQGEIVVVQPLPTSNVLD